MFKNSFRLKSAATVILSFAFLFLIQTVVIKAQTYEMRAMTEETSKKATKSSNYGTFRGNRFYVGKNFVAVRKGNLVTIRQAGTNRVRETVRCNCSAGKSSCRIAISGNTIFFAIRRQAVRAKIVVDCPFNNRL